jgi:hypothetical protein
VPATGSQLGRQNRRGWKMLSLSTYLVRWSWGFVFKNMRKRSLFIELSLLFTSWASCTSASQWYSIKYLFLFIVGGEIELLVHGIHSPRMRYLIYYLQAAMVFWMTNLHKNIWSAYKRVDYEYLGVITIILCVIYARILSQIEVSYYYLYLKIWILTICH